jgi:nuclear GTP-binding protein
LCRYAPVPKDPGIPHAWPYKDELMKEIDFEVEKKKALAEAKAGGCAR